MFDENVLYRLFYVIVLTKYKFFAILSTIMKMIQKLEQSIYGYDPTEFLPIFRDGVLDNRLGFIAYKAGKVGQALGHIGVNALEVFDDMVAASGRR